MKENDRRSFTFSGWATALLLVVVVVLLSRWVGWSSPLAVVVNLMAWCGLGCTLLMMLLIARAPRRDDWD